ncbi:MAG: Ku protein [Verrucomicrobiales bacterium]|nr:Ku protein [Verrucomicrobiales bacterium]
MASRSIWKGHISFGLVNIPVSLHSAESRPDIGLHMVDSKNRKRIRYEKVNDETGEEVPWDRIVKGYEYEDDKYVLLSEEELSQIKREVTKTIEIDDFVDLDSVDVMFFDKPYYLVPEKKSKPARKGYALLRETLRATGKAGISQVVIRSREYLCAVLVRGDLLVLELLRFAQELRDPADYDVPGSDLKEIGVTAKEIDMATQLITAMETDWDPTQYHDTYREDLMKWIEDKIAKGKTEVIEESDEDESETEGENVIDLMAYLKKSVAEAKKKSPKKKTSAKKRAKKKTGKSKAS